MYEVASRTLGGGASSSSWACKLCHRILHTVHGYRAHVESVHLKVRRYRCDSCTYSSYKKHDMQKHFVRNTAHKGSLRQPRKTRSLEEIELAVAELLSRGGGTQY